MLGSSDHLTQFTYSSLEMGDILVGNKHRGPCGSHRSNRIKPGTLGCAGDRWVLSVAQGAICRPIELVSKGKMAHEVTLTSSAPHKFFIKYLRCSLGFMVCARVCCHNPFGVRVEKRCYDLEQPSSVHSSLTPQRNDLMVSSSLEILSCCPSGTPIVSCYFTNKRKLKSFCLVMS